eukprot:gene8456-9360_t
MQEYHQTTEKEACFGNNKNKPITAKTPLEKVTTHKLSQAIKNLRLNQKKLEAKIKELNQQIETNGIQLDPDLHDDFQNLIENVKQELPEDSFEKLFWEQQQSAFQSNPKGTRWHPMMIRFALHIDLRSPSTYKALRESGVIKLPSERTLRDYSNVFHPSPGFKKETFDDLKHQASKLQEIGKYVVLAFDEVSIKDDLVFDNQTGFLSANSLFAIVCWSANKNQEQRSLVIPKDFCTDFMKSSSFHISSKLTHMVSLVFGEITEVVVMPLQVLKNFDFIDSCSG